MSTRLYDYTTREEDARLADVKAAVKELHTNFTSVLNMLEEKIGAAYEEGKQAGLEQGQLEADKE